MNTTIKNHKGEQFEIETYFDQTFKGRGGWNINCEVSYKGNRKTFHHYTTDSMFVDEISDMKADNYSWGEIQAAYKEKAFDSMKESILEWCEENKPDNYELNERRKTALNIAVGQSIFYLLRLNISKSGKIKTAFGDKTIQGLGATINRIIEEENERLEDY